MKQVDKNKDKEEAILVKLIAATAIRPGSDNDTKAKVKAYGATTLQKRHVVKREGKIYLDFIGKKGVHINLPVEDKEVAKTLWAKAKQAKHQEGNLFNTDRGKLLEFVHSLDGGGFKTKDFRTLQGTKQAMQHVEQMPAPTNAKEYKKQVREVAKKVAEKLGNTHTVCLQAYINPSVFAEWRMNAGV